MIKDVIVQQVITENLNIITSYKKLIYNKYPVAINKIHNNYYQDLLQDQDFINFAQANIDFFTQIHANGSIFDKNHNRFLTFSDRVIENLANDKVSNPFNVLLESINQYFLSTFMPYQTINDAYAGEISNAIIKKTSSVNLYDINSQRIFIRSYIPIIDDQFTVSLIIEIIIDITAQWQNIYELERYIVFTIIFICLIFLLIIISNRKQVEQLIQDQFTMNKSLRIEKQKAENENMLKTDFLANMGHELRAPLNIIIGFSELIINSNKSASINADRGYIQDINDAGKHLLNIINDILDLSKASVDKLRIEYVPIDLAKLIISTINFMRIYASEAGITISHNLLLIEQTIIIVADPQRLKQVLLNLLSNSIKFTPKNGTVKIEVTQNITTKIISIKVIDDGIGMQEQDIPKALSAFAQIDNKFKKQYKNVGLGLKLTKKLVELMNGTFDIKSKIGHGTTITLIFNSR